MLKASDLEKVDQMFPFFGVITDNLCGNEDFAHVSNFFTLYSELLLMLNQNPARPGRTERKLEEFNSKMVEFKTYGFFVIVKHQAS